MSDTTWMINPRGKSILVDVRQVEELKQRDKGWRVLPHSMLNHEGNPKQKYFPQYDTANPTRETEIVEDDDLGEILQTEIL